MEHTISQCIPPIGESLALYKGKEVVERIGEHIIKDVVTSILCGGNVRSLTEGLTRRRLALSNASLLVTFLHAHAQIDNFNVLRNSDEEFDKYMETVEDALRQSAESCRVDFGQLQGTLQLDDVECAVDWPFILYLFTAIGAQTLSIRGSEKSMYGKMFEKLILGSLLTILGFKLIDPTDSSRMKKVFWLSSRGDKRESDATLLYKPGVGVRFDIGFIGPGNTEISLDKVSRFEREMEHGRQNHYMSTIIIVDRIGEKSRIIDMANAIDGNVVQMSMAYWVKDVCKILNERIQFKHRVLQISEVSVIYRGGHISVLSSISAKMATTGV